MWGKEFFDGIQLVYERELETLSGEKRKETIDGALCGNNNARDAAYSPTVEFFLLPGEMLTGMSGRKGAWTDCLRLETSLGRVLSCGGNGGGDFKVNIPSNQEIRAISFEVGDHLTNVLAYVGKSSASASNVKGVSNAQEMHSQLIEIFATCDAPTRANAVAAGKNDID